MRAANDNRLPNGMQPRGLCRVAAAAYLGIGGTLFDQLVVRGEMPTARRAGGRVLWDRYELDEAFDALPRDGIVVTDTINPWDTVGAA